MEVGKILAAHQAKPLERGRQHRTVLAIQDTRSLVSTSPRQPTGLGQVALKKGKRVKKIPSPGLLMQSCLALTTEGVALGLLDQKIFARDAVARDQTKQRNVLPIEAKERSRWRAVLKNSKPGRGQTQLVRVCDREAAIYALFQLSAALAAPVLVRANSESPSTKGSL